MWVGVCVGVGDGGRERRGLRENNIHQLDDHKLYM